MERYGNFTSYLSGQRDASQHHRQPKQNPPRRSNPHAIPPEFQTQLNAALARVTTALYWSEETWNEPSVRISRKTRTGEPLVVRTAVAPGPPLWTTNSKGTPLPTPRPVI